jgi:periplasmic protein TonB
MSITLSTRHTILRKDPLGPGFAGAFALHAAAVGVLLGWAYLTHSGQHWGNADATNGAIQATMVNSVVPLPQKQPVDPNNVLATESPSPAPIAPAPHTVEAPKADAIPIPVKPTTKPLPAADKTTPPPPLHPQPAKVDPNKAQTGEAGGVRVAMSSTQTHAGTFSVGVTDTAFGTRFAFYIQQINQKLASQWYVGMLDGQASGHRVYITFQIARDGSPSNIKIEQPSGDATLDQTALNAVRHIDTFGPLPDAYQGSYVNAQYYFEAPPHP